MLAGIPDTKAVRKWFRTWGAKEGVGNKDAMGPKGFNWLNTTQVDSSDLFGNFFRPRISHFGRNISLFQSFWDGAATIAATLHNGNYPAILATLMTGNPQRTAEVVRELRLVWGTKDW